MKNISLSLILIVFFFVAGMSTATAQVANYNLREMLEKNQIITVAAYQTKVLNDAKKDGITSKGIIWLNGIDFKEGIIDIDLRGKDEFLNSFLGIAFHGTDTSHCEILYFRPFNFRHTDSSRWKWSVAYMQVPDFNYGRLRKEHPGVYENRIVPPPEATAWFHARIVIRNRHLAVFVNHAEKPSLELTTLEGRQDGLFGLYSDGLTNDFANLTIQP